MIKNIIANFLGKFWSLFSIYIFTPIYIQFLGIESFGIISFYSIVLGFVGLLDIGLSATLTREFAKKSTVIDKIITLKTLEYIYIIIAIIIIVFFYSS